MNKEVEVTNQTILCGLKTRLDKTKEIWADELYSVLWTYEMTYWLLTRETPFNLAFKTKAIIPQDLDLLISLLIIPI